MLRTCSLTLLRWCCWQTASVGLMLLLINRWLILWVDGPLKTISIAVVSLVAVGAAAWMATQLSVIMLVAPCAVLLLLGGGELRRGWLRANYRVQANPLQDMRSQLAHPITTRTLTVQHYRIAAPRMPHVRIAQLTDLHFDEALPDAYFDGVFQRVRAERPDIIVLTGDYVSRDSSLAIMRRLMPRLPAAPMGTFAVLGNHDYWCGAASRVREQLAAQGIRWLGGRCATLGVAGTRRLVLCGDERPWGPSAPADAVTSEDYVVVLSHTVDNIYAWSTRADLMFAGHNHGGQIRLPVLGALVVPSVYGRRFDWGRFQVERTNLLVSAGIGVDAPPVRLFCPPEIVVADLGR